MSSTAQIVLLLSSTVLVLVLVLVPGTRSRPATEDQESAPRWVTPETMTNQFQTVLMNRPVKFLCRATGNPTPSLRWYKNGIEITADQRIDQVKIRNHTWTLKIQSARPSHTGNFTCVVENRHGSLKHTFLLDVIEVDPTRPLLQNGLPADQTAAVGTDVTFECKVLSGPSPHIQWLKHITINGSAVGPDGLPYVRMLKTAGKDTDMEVLTLRNVSLDDAGGYICLVGNMFGISYRSARLTVVSRPSGNIPQTLEMFPAEAEPSRPLLQDGLPADQTAAVGSHVTFECKVLSGVFLHVQWLKHLTINGSAVGPDGHPYVRVLKTAGKGTDMDVLTLRNVSLDDAGEYTCLVGNMFGISYRSAKLTVVNRFSRNIPQNPEIQGRFSLNV